VSHDGEIATTARRSGGRRCRRGPPGAGDETVPGQSPNVGAGAAPPIPIRFDEPEVQQVRRDALAWWIPLLGDELVCLTTLVLDASHYGGAITVATSPRFFEDDPFARIFAGTTVETDLFARVPPPTGPAIERYSGLAWPGGAFRNR